MKDKLTVSTVDLAKTEKALWLAGVNVLRTHQLGADLNKVEIKCSTVQQIFEAGKYFEKVSDTPKDVTQTTTKTLKDGNVKQKQKTGSRKTD